MYHNDIDISGPKCGGGRGGGGDNGGGGDEDGLVGLAPRWADAYLPVSSESPASGSLSAPTRTYKAPIWDPHPWDI